MFNFTHPHIHTNGHNIKNFNKFAVIKAAHSLVLCAAFFVQKKIYDY